MSICYCLQCQIHEPEIEYSYLDSHQLISLFFYFQPSLVRVSGHHLKVLKWFPYPGLTIYERLTCPPLRPHSLYTINVYLHLGISCVDKSIYAFESMPQKTS